MIALDTRLHTARCVLTRAQEHDFQAIQVARRYVDNVIDLAWDAPPRGASAGAWARSATDLWRRSLSYSFVARDIESLNFIGQLCIATAVPCDRALLSCWVHPLRTDRGLVTELVAAGLEFAFEQLHVAEVGIYHADTAPQGKAAVRLGGEVIREVLEGLGMSVVRAIPRGLRRDDRWIEISEFGLSAQTWRARISCAIRSLPVEDGVRRFATVA